MRVLASTTDADGNLKYMSAAIGLDELRSAIEHIGLVPGGMQITELQFSRHGALIELRAADQPESR